jgi:DNA-binding HxlR family transcriptional regulator
MPLPTYESPIAVISEKPFNSFYATPQTCAVTRAMSLIGGRWKPIILWALVNDVNRFNALCRAIPAISKKVLTAQLRELERDGLIERIDYRTVPARVEYRLTEHGWAARPLLLALGQFGRMVSETVAATPAAG